MNYIEAYKKKFDKEPTEDEIAVMMQAVAKEDQQNLKNRSNQHRPNAVVPLIDLLSWGSHRGTWTTKIMMKTAPCE